MVCLKVAFHLQQQIDILDDFMTALKDFGYVKIDRMNMHCKSLWIKCKMHTFNLNNAKAMRMINYQTEDLMWKKKKSKWFKWKADISPSSQPLGHYF